MKEHGDNNERIRSCTVTKLTRRWGDADGSGMGDAISWPLGPQRGCRSRALVSSAYDSGSLRVLLVQLARTHKKDRQRSLRIGHKALARTDACPRMSTLQLPHRTT